MTAAPLYELGAALSAAFAEINAELAQNQGEFTPEMQARLDAAEMAFADKVERVALYCRSLAADATAIKSEEERLAARRKALEKRAAWLKDSYLRHALESQQRDTVPGTLATVKLALNPPAASSSLPLEFLDPRWVRSETKLSLDKEAILVAHRSGETLPEGVSVQRATSVRIT